MVPAVLIASGSKLLQDTNENVLADPEARAHEVFDGGPSFRRAQKPLSMGLKDDGRGPSRFEPSKSGELYREAVVHDNGRMEGLGKGDHVRLALTE